MLCHAIVKRPERTAFELVVARVAELLNGVIDFALRQSLGINQVDKEIGGAIARDLGRLVSVDALAHVRPVRNNARDCVSENARKIVHDVLCVLASKLHIRREAKIFANHHLVADAHRSGKTLVVRVTQPTTKRRSSDSMSLPLMAKPPKY